MKICKYIELYLDDNWRKLNLDKNLHNSNNFLVLQHLLFDVVSCILTKNTVRYAKENRSSQQLFIENLINVHFYGNLEWQNGYY